MTKDTTPMDKTSKIWAVTFLMAMAGLLLFVAYDSYAAYQKTKTWIPVDAQIITSKLESGNGVHLDVTVRVNGQNQAIPADLVYGTFISQNDYKELAEQYPTGTKTTIFQNPNDPTAIVLQRPERLNPFAYLWGGLGLLLIVISIRTLRR